MKTTLAAAVGAENLLGAPALAHFAVDGVVPAAGVSPTTVEQAAAVMKAAHTLGLAVTARGGGTAMSYGAPPERVDVLLSARRLNRILEYEPADLTCTVEAGITLGDLNEALGKHGQMLPLEAPLAGQATIGGVLAVNASGPRRFAYGTARDRLIGVRAIEASGAVIKGGGKVVKNVAGYDVPKMFVGSLGTLGIIVEATFKLSPVPKARAALLAGFRELAPALEAAQSVLKSGLRPNAFDLTNATTHHRIATRSGVADFSDRPYILALDFGAGPVAVQRQVSQAHRTLAQAGGKTAVIDDPIMYDAYWRSLVDTGKTGDRSAAMITRASLLFTQLERIVHGHEALAESSRMEVALDIHLGAGVVRAAWFPNEPGHEADGLLAETVSTL
ncbi:MAG: FAD-binding oxidoreductase, partial [Chloroflexi bacterium]|nr:FAD-binding oxidoreductase [Chloroflexota bacterium]